MGGWASVGWDKRCAEGEVTGNVGDDLVMQCKPSG